MIAKGTMCIFELTICVDYKIKSRLRMFKDKVNILKKSSNKKGPRELSHSGGYVAHSVVAPSDTILADGVPVTQVAGVPTEEICLCGVSSVKDSTYFINPKTVDLCLFCLMKSVEDFRQDWITTRDRLICRDNYYKGRSVCARCKNTLPTYTVPCCCMHKFWPPSGTLIPEPESDSDSSDSF